MGFTKIYYFQKQDEHSDSIRQLERLQTEVSTLAFSSSSSDLGVEAALRMEEDEAALLASPVVSSSRRRREERDSEEAAAQVGKKKLRFISLNRQYFAIWTFPPLSFIPFDFGKIYCLQKLCSLPTSNAQGSPPWIFLLLFHNLFFVFLPFFL